MLKNRDCLLCPEPSHTPFRPLAFGGERTERAVPPFFSKLLKLNRELTVLGQRSDHQAAPRLPAGTRVEILSRGRFLLPATESLKPLNRTQQYAAIRYGIERERPANSNAIPSVEAPRRLHIRRENSKKSESNYRCQGRSLLLADICAGPCGFSKAGAQGVGGISPTSGSFEKI